MLLNYPPVLWEFVARAKKSVQTNLESPESQISPYEDIDTKQRRITGEAFPTLALGICDKCLWCYNSINERGAVQVCPVCKGVISQIPMSIEEVCVVEENEKHSITLSFSRRLPLR